MDKGFAATTISSIASSARVSPETVYATFGNKRTVLAALIDTAIAGDDAPVAVRDRAWVQALRDDPDPARRVASLARNGSAILARRSAIDEVVREAAATDPEIAAFHAAMLAERLAGQRELLALVAGDGGLRDGLDLDTAADILFALGSPEVWRLLVVDRGWRPERFEAWYARVIASLLGAPDGSRSGYAPEDDSRA